MKVNDPSINLPWYAGVLCFASIPFTRIIIMTVLDFTALSVDAMMLLLDVFDSVLLLASVVCFTSIYWNVSKLTLAIVCLSAIPLVTSRIVLMQWWGGGNTWHDYIPGIAITIIASTSAVYTSIQPRDKISARIFTVSVLAFGVALYEFWLMSSLSAIIAAFVILLLIFIWQWQVRSDGPPNSQALN